jgi:3-methyladenine DNA glycosylase AlkD
MGKPKSPDTVNARPAGTSGIAQPALDWLHSHASRATLDGMARYAIPSGHALGVTMADMKVLAKQLGRDHALAAALWDTGIYEARMVACMVEEPAQVTAAQMERWCKDFDNWAICDTVCFNLFDRVPHAWAKVEPWSRKRDEFQKRTAFALLWALALHDKKAADAQFIEGLALVEQAAGDERNFVKKAVAMALKAIGKRNAALKAAALQVATRLATSADPTAKWIGKDALRELAGK